MAVVGSQEEGCFSVDCQWPDGAAHYPCKHTVTVPPIGQFIPGFDMNQSGSPSPSPLDGSPPEPSESGWTLNQESWF